MLKKMMKENERYVLVLTLLVAAFVLVFIPLKIIGYGYLPTDDALRHTAKAVSGKGWNEILVVREGIKQDSHPGWHAVLKFLHKTFKWNQDALVVFSVVALFIIFCIPPLFSLKFIEAWLGTLLLFAIAEFSFIWRLLYGRPFAITMAVLAVICFSWKKFASKEFPKGRFLFLSLLITLSVWLHCAWYMFAIVIFSLIIAREWRAALRIGIAWALGTIIGSILAGDPAGFLMKHSIFDVVFKSPSSSVQRMLVTELQPATGDIIMVMIVCGLLVLHYIRGKWDKARVDNPVFYLLMTSWILGFIFRRFWLDWGLVAAAVWIAEEAQYFISGLYNILSWRRVIITLVISAALFLAVTNDIDSRWTSNLTTEYLSEEDPCQAGWLPSPGGIIYSNDMTIFYQTFFHNPRAKWRYILGFEAEWMPPADLAIFRNIQWNNGAFEAFEPWVAKMKPEDRLILRYGAALPPKIEGLDWNYTATGVWVGRKKR